MFTDDFIIPNDMSNLCRVCLQLPDTSQYLDLSTIYDEDDNLTYSECFTICTKIDLNAGDGIPHHLCKPCGIELQMSYDFHKKIEESKKVVEQFQKQIKMKTVDHTELESINAEPKKHNLSECGKSLKHVIDQKYVLSGYDDDDDDAQKNDSSAENEMVYETQQQNNTNFADPVTINNEPDEVEVMNECKTEADAQYDISLGDKLSNAKMNENFEDHFEIEALEEEEKKCELDTNINIKKEVLDKERDMQTSDECKEIAIVQPDNTNIAHSLWYSNFVKTETTNTNTEEFKLENESVGEYSISYPTVPTELINVLSFQNQNLEPPFKCKFCDHTTSIKNSLYKHMQRKHKHELTKAKPASINCPFCYKTFSKVSFLGIHITDKHSNVRYACEYCGHNVPTKNALSQHRLRKHPDMKKQTQKLGKLKCLLCSEHFETEESLNLHKKSKHVKKPTQKGEKTSVQCQDCGHTLPTRNALSKHRFRKHRNKKGT